MLNTTTLSEANFRFPDALSGELATVVLLVLFCLFSCFEFNFPRERQPLKPLRLSYKTNIGLLIFNSTLMSLLSVSSLFIIAQRYSGQGLLRYIPDPALQALLSFLALDLLLYFWHKACHQFSSLWMFHRVHHNDFYLNTSTAFRIHFLELLFTNLLKAAYIITLGIDQVLVLINETLMTIFIMFHHSNISFKGERLLGRIFIVPYLHLTHHSTERNEHDRNYGAALSLWDRLFGTLAETKPVAVGIKGSSPQNLISLIKFGFSRLKAPNMQTLPANFDNMIAEAAYYRAEKRNFKPGYEVIDWLEAKKDIIKLIYCDNSVRVSKKPQRNNLFLNLIPRH
ncbi:MAG: sterol desaturase family protein [Methylovulum sp.]|nr:sterol desaturase family protein [Methylovulum sp.]